MTKGSNNFPETIVDVVQLLNNYKVPMRHQHNQEPDGNSVAFVQGDGWPAAPKSEIKCWHCSKKGHYKNECLKLQLQVLDVGVQNLLVDKKWELDLFVNNE
jgi:hypothetical protein